MKIFRGFEEANGIKNPVVTTGSFDGVHIGHKKILARLKMLAEKYNGESVLITFDPHPRKVLYPETAGKDLKLINSREEKLELLKKAGLDNVIIVEFTKEFSKVTSEEFVRDYLHEMLMAKVVVVGFNHHFGFNKEGDYKHLWGWREKYNFEAEEIPEQEVQHETVSSTKIRKAISEGYIQRANAYLDHYYIIMGKPEGREPAGSLSFMKIPITEECKILPATGIYAVSVVCDQMKSRGMSVICQESGKKPEVYVHIFENEEKFPGNNSLILFHKMIYGSVSLADTQVSRRLEFAKAQISELIY
ncbi:MAG: adenylyltransferase/cytidyltransferase family protein [Bacteroidales bacterium]|jgi:riboflavin kinase/FMN adenylyltransferase|nr:adenylyltransferase/cytidyltransferase family protein [Bacteroidales bacterium]